MANKRKPQMKASQLRAAMRRIAREAELTDLREGRRQRAVTFQDRSKVVTPFHAKSGGRARDYDN